jgi:serine protease SohB
MSVGDTILIIFVALLIGAVFIGILICCCGKCCCGSSKSIKKFDKFTLESVNDDVNNFKSYIANIELGGIVLPVIKKKDKPKKRIYVIKYDANFKTILHYLLYSKLEDVEIYIEMKCPGGSTTEFSEMFYLMCKLRTRVKMTVFVNEMVASGGYLLACVAHKIVLGPFDEVGSIGVFADRYDITNLMEKVGVAVHYSKAGKYKRMGMPTNQPDNDEKEYIAKEVKNMHNTFIQVVKKYRPNIIDESFEGQCFTGQEAVDTHFADEIGHIQEYFADNLDYAEIYRISSEKSSGKLDILAKIWKLFN